MTNHSSFLGFFESATYIPSYFAVATKLSNLCHGFSTSLDTFNPKNWGSMYWEITYTVK